MRFGKPVFLILAFSALSLSCGKKSKQDNAQVNPDPDDASLSREELIKEGKLVGIYRIDEEKAKKGYPPYFVITANNALYNIEQRQTDLIRDYQGDISDIEFEYSKGNLTSGGIVCQKVIDRSSLPAELQIVDELNEVALNLLKKLNERNVSLQVRLERESPSFSKNQIEIVRKLDSAVDDLAAFIKANGANSFWINDFTNTKSYWKDNAFNLPAGVSTGAEEYVSKIKDKTLETENFR